MSALWSSFCGGVVLVDMRALRIEEKPSREAALGARMKGYSGNKDGSRKLARGKE